MFCMSLQREHLLLHILLWSTATCLLPQQASRTFQTDPSPTPLPCLLPPSSVLTWVREDVPWCLMEFLKNCQWISHHSFWWRKAVSTALMICKAYHTSVIHYERNVTFNVELNMNSVPFFTFLFTTTANDTSQLAPSFKFIKSVTYHSGAVSFFSFLAHEHRITYVPLAFSWACKQGTPQVKRSSSSIFQ